MFPLRREITGLLMDGRWGLAVKGRGNGAAKGVGRWPVKGWDREALEALVSSLPRGRGGRAAVTAPLAGFEVVQLSFPPVPEEAMAVAVSYQLTRSVGDVASKVFDWIEVGRDARKVDVLAFCMERSSYEAMDGILARHGYRLTYLEPDISAAAAYLHIRDGELAPPGANILILLLWEESLTLGIKEGESIAVARSVSIRAVEPVELGEEEAEEPSPGGGADILEAFGLVEQASGQEEPGEEGGEDPLEAQRRRYRDYLDDVVLEAVRTRDYFTSVIKRGRLDGVAVGGPETVVDHLTPMLGRALELPVHPIPGEGLGVACTGAQLAVAAGSVMGR